MPTKKRLGKTGFMIFPVVYGGIVSMFDGQKRSDRYVATAIERGVNYFDVAPTYGDAEEKLGNSLKPYRKNIYLACKTVERTRESAAKELHASLEHFACDYVDMYQLHSLSTPQDLATAFAPGGVIELLDEAKRKGLTRKVGITSHNEEIALEAIKRYDFDCVMFPLNWQLNLLDGRGNRLIAEAKKRDMGILGMKTLAHRRWLGDTDIDPDRGDFTKSWCKVINPRDKEFGIAAMKYSFAMGANAVIPPGNYNSFAFALENINQVLSSPLSGAEKALLEREFIPVKDYPFLEKNGRMNQG